MKAYFSTFVTGTDGIIQKTISKKPKDKFRVISLLDGLIMYETDIPLREVRNIRYFNNSFVLFHLFKGLKDDPLVFMVRETIKNPKLHSFISPNVPPGATAFKIVTSLENQTVAVDRTLIKSLESKISQVGRLRVSVQRADIEFWFLARSEGIGLFGMRITYPYYKDTPLEKGELRHQLAHILCLASRPTPSDVVLDPFSGHGAIPLERARSFPYKEIIAVESDATLVKRLRKRAGKVKNFVIKHADALRLDLKDGSIDKIVTDPPWGIFKEAALPLSEFYTKMLSEFHRVLKPNGVAVVLVGNKSAFEEAMRQSKFSLEEAHNILVSGKKAAVFIIRKF